MGKPDEIAEISALLRTIEGRQSAEKTKGELSLPEPTREEAIALLTSGEKKGKCEEKDEDEPDTP